MSNPDDICRVMGHDFRYDSGGFFCRCCFLNLEKKILRRSRPAGALPPPGCVDDWMDGDERK